MKNRFVTSRIFNIKITLNEDKTIICERSGKLFSTANIKDISANGYDFKPFDLDEWNLIKIAGAFIAIKDFLGWEPQKTFNLTRTSYGIKHDVEIQPIYQEVTKLIGEKHTHLSNGELIVAMLLLGFKIKKQTFGINVCFNIKKNYSLEVNRNRN